MFSAYGCETFMSNRSKDELGRMLRANLGRTMSLGLSVLPTGKGQIQKAFKQEIGLIGSVFQKEKFCMWIKESRELGARLCVKDKNVQFIPLNVFL